QIYNNTIANIKGTVGFGSGLHAESGINVSTWKLENNLWYNDDPAGIPQMVMADEDYNTLLNTSEVGNQMFTGAHDFDTTSGSADPFTADTGANPTITGFQLKSETVDAHLNDGV